MDASSTLTWQEVIRTLIGGTVPLTIYLVGRFFKNKWEKKQAAAQAEEDELDNEKKRLELAQMYKDMAREAAQEAVTQSDIVRRLQADGVKQTEEISNLTKCNALLTAQVTSMSLDIIILKREKETLIAENITLTARVLKLEELLEKNNIDLPNGKMA
jgi:hypothetical protein